MNVAALRRGILFLLGAICLLGAIFEDPIHLTSLFVGLMLMGVITWEQISATIGRDSRQKNTPSDPRHGSDGATPPI
jgi:hypothetical protein